MSMVVVGYSILSCIVLAWLRVCAIEPAFSDSVMQLGCEYVEHVLQPVVVYGYLCDVHFQCVAHVVVYHILHIKKPEILL